MVDKVEDYEGAVSIGGCTIINLRAADDIDGLGRQEQELVSLAKHHDEASTAYRMQISAKKTQLLTNNTNGITTDIAADNKKFEIIIMILFLYRFSMLNMLNWAD